MTWSTWPVPPNPPTLQLQAGHEHGTLLQLLAAFGSRRFRPSGDILPSGCRALSLQYASSCRAPILTTEATLGTAGTAAVLEGADQSGQHLDTGPGGVQPVPAPLHVGVQLQPGRDPGHSHHSQHHHVACRPLLPHRSDLLALSAARSKFSTQGPGMLCTSSPERQSMSHAWCQLHVRCRLAAHQAVSEPDTRPCMVRVLVWTFLQPVAAWQLACF